MKCSKCYGNRWLIWEQGWSDAKILTATQRPWSRDLWQHTANHVRATLIISKTLTACPECNPEKLAPWADKFRDTGTGSGSSSTDKRDDTPF